MIVPETTDQLITDLLINFQQLGRGFVKIHNISSLTPGQAFVLKLIADAKWEGKQGICTSNLSKKMDVAHPTVTPVIHSMVKMGLLYRERDKQDRRIIWIRLTEKGEEVFSQYYTVLHSRFGKLLAAMGEEESKQFVVLLRKANAFFATFNETEDSNETCL